MLTATPCFYSHFNGNRSLTPFPQGGISPHPFPKRKSPFLFWNDYSKVTAGELHLPKPWAQALA